MLVTISLNGDHRLSYDLITEDIPRSMTITDLKGFIAAQTGVSSSKFQLWFNGSPIPASSPTIGSAGVTEGDILVAQFSGSNQTTSSSRPDPPPGNASGMPRPDPEQLRLQILGDPTYLAQFRRQQPALAAKLDNPTAWRLALEEIGRNRDRAMAARDAEMRALQEDEMNPEAQAKIEEMIRQEQVDANFEMAMENNPEIFGRVYMLYIPVEVNGKQVTAFVDSGAQTTIMSPETAERVGIMRLVDKRYAGLAVGVGTAKIIGRVHSASIKIGTLHLTCSFTVMEGKGVDLLLGLDMLKRHQACIDLAQDALILSGQKIPFLGESQIPRMDRMPIELDEPTIEGPEGSQLGAVSGSVINPPRSAQQGLSPQTSRTAPAPAGFQGAPRTLGGSTAPAQAAQSRRVPQNRPAPSTHDASKIDHLVSLGFSRERAVQALDATNGNLEYAAGFLFDQ